MSVKFNLLNKSGFKIFGVSTMGKSHQVVGKPCEDSFGHRVLNNEIFLAAVSDGAGSAIHSRMAANIAVNSALECGLRLLGRFNSQLEDEEIEEYLWKSVKFVRGRLEKYTKRLNSRLRDFACTLLLVIVIRDRIGIAHIGDGGIVAETKDGAVNCVSHPQNGEYINQTYFLSDSDFQDKVRMRVLHEPVNSIALMTDGVQCPTFKGAQPFEPFYRPLFAFTHEAKSCTKAEKEIEAMLSSKDFQKKSDDDKTLVICSLNGGYR